VGTDGGWEAGTNGGRVKLGQAGVAALETAGGSLVGDGLAAGVRAVRTSAGPADLGGSGGGGLGGSPRSPAPSGDDLVIAGMEKQFPSGLGKQLDVLGPAPAKPPMDIVDRAAQGGGAQERVLGGTLPGASSPTSVGTPSAPAEQPEVPSSRMGGGSGPVTPSTPAMSSPERVTSGSVAVLARPQAAPVAPTSADVV